MNKNEIKPKVFDILYKYFNPNSYKRYSDGDFYLISHSEYLLLKKELYALGMNSVVEEGQ